MTERLDSIALYLFYVYPSISWVGVVLSMTCEAIRRIIDIDQIRLRSRLNPLFDSCSITSPARQRTTSPNAFSPQMLDGNHTQREVKRVSC